MPAVVIEGSGRRPMLRGLWISKKRNICQALERNIKNRGAGHLAGTVGSRAGLGDQGRSCLLWCCLLSTCVFPMRTLGFKDFLPLPSPAMLLNSDISESQFSYPEINSSYGRFFYKIAPAL